MTPYLDTLKTSFLSFLKRPATIYNQQRCLVGFLGAPWCICLAQPIGFPFSAGDKVYSNVGMSTSLNTDYWFRLFEIFLDNNFRWKSKSYLVELETSNNDLQFQDVRIRTGKTCSSNYLYALCFPFCRWCFHCYGIQSIYGELLAWKLYWPWRNQLQNRIRKNRSRSTWIHRQRNGKRSFYPAEMYSWIGLVCGKGTVICSVAVLMWSKCSDRLLPCVVLTRKEFCRGRIQPLKKYSSCVIRLTRRPEKVRVA